MKNEIRLALLCMAAASAPAFAQGYTPQCGSANLDRSMNVFTITSPAPNAVNQQCFITVYPAGNMPSEARQNAGSYFAEGYYNIELAGGGGGGGGGAMGDQGGGGGGAGAAPSRTNQYLSPGVYKLTIGSGGMGGAASGGWTQAGNPTSLTRMDSGQLVAGFAGADRWTQQGQAATDGHGGIGQPGGSTGGSGGDSGMRSEEQAQSGSASATPGYAGVAGQAGGETGRSGRTVQGGRDNVVQANAGGGGGASVGSGGAGDSAGRSGVSGIGTLGAGGGGGSGGLNVADAGGRGGHGFIRLELTEATQAFIPTQEVAPAFVSNARAAEPARSGAAYEQAPAQNDMRPARQDRN